MYKPHAVFIVVLCKPQKMIELLRKPFIVIEYNPLKRLLQLEWKGTVTTPEFIDVTDFISQKALDLDIPYILIDTRYQGTVQKEATDYASMKLGELFQTKLQKVLFVLPISLYTQMSVEMFQNQIGKGTHDVPIQYFATLKDAYDFLAVIEQNAKR
jgi:hypothetical protein